MNNIELAKKYFKEKYLCSQAVFAAFAVQYGLPEKQALKIAACFGSGMCSGEVCGAVTGALMAIGLKYGQYLPNDTDSKNKTNELARLMLSKFKEENGSYLCKDLLGYDLSLPKDVLRAKKSGLFSDFCPKIVESASRILEEILSSEDNK